VERVADIEPGQIHLDELGDGIDRNMELDRMADDVQSPAALQAWGGLFIEEVHRNIQREPGAFTDAQEVHMQQEVADGVELVILRDDADRLSTHVDVQEVGQKPARLHPKRQLLQRQRNGNRRLLVAIDDGRDLALTTHGTGGPLADPVAHLGRELVCLAHGSCS
jgi:hypothetical protein